ncbi:MAG: glycine oxidase ThiO [Solirubrobacterales bacterium]
MPNRSEQPVDLVVVGAGVIGLACAWRAAQRGMSVRVLERDLPGSGASGVAAGMLAPVGEATWGEEGLLDLALAAHGAWPGFAAELADATGLDVGFLGLGALHAAFDGDEARELRRRHELMQELGLEAEWLTPTAARELEPRLSPRCAGAVHAPHESAVDPRALVRALRAAAERKGVVIVTGAEVVGGLGGGDAIEGVRTADGSEHAAATVLLAAGAWSAAEWLPERARPPVRPVKGEILTLRGSGPAPCERLVLSERVYLVPRPGGHLVVGATVSERGFDTAVSAGGVHELLREAYRALPDIAELELVGMFAGLRPGTPDNAPLVGPGALAGLHLATGHFRNGVLMAPITADAVAAALAGEEPPPAIIAADPARFRAGAPAAMAPK